MTVEQEKKSTHKCEVVEVNFTKHPNADSLSVSPIFGYSYVGRTADWVGVKRAVYIPPDSTVDVRRPEFAHLAQDAKADGRARIKAKKLRGVVSYGLCVPVPDDTPLGEDWAERLGIQHYEPAIVQEAGRGGLFMGGEVAQAPTVHFVKYDLDAGRRYGKQVFVEGEPVVISEKIHGASARYVFSDDRINVGSRTEWKKEYPDYSHVTVESLEPKVGREKAELIVAGLKEKASRPQRNMWWQAMDATPALRPFLEGNPGLLVYGEVYGAVQDLTYGHQKGQVSFAAFDMMRDGRWLDFEEAHDLAVKAGLPWVPVLKVGVPFNFDEVCALAEGPSTIPDANHLREGVVVRTLKERWDSKVGRVCLKWVGGGYLERSK